MRLAPDSTASMVVNWIPEWRIRVVGSLSFNAMDLYYACQAAGVPSGLNFYIDNSIPYAARDTGAYGIWPFGTDPATIILFAQNDPNFSPKNAAGLCYVGEDKVSCIVFDDDTDLGIGNRIYHEVIHAICNCGNPDEMVSTDVAEFCEYLKQKYGAGSAYATQFCANPSNYAHSSEYQKDFYEMLGKRYFPWCFPGGGLPPPEAGFHASITAGTAPLTVMFFADCENAEAVEWDFGDGSTSTQLYPTHTYTQAGWYDVRLIARNTNGSDTEILYDYIHVTENLVQPLANFSASVRTGSVPLTVSFVDQSTGDVTNWQWEFGDGGMSYVRDPTHTYGVVGTYNVKLTVWNPQDPPDSVTKQGYIVASPYEPPATEIIPEFSAYPRSGRPPLTVAFNDLSSGNPTWWHWDFGDGTTSSVKSPSKTYSSSGTYSVQLTVGNATQTKMVTVENFITVSATSDPPVEVRAWFKFGPSKGFAPLTVFFSDASDGSPTSWKWNFGDGTESQEQNPIHTYLQSGYYDVTLQVNNGSTSDGVSVESAVRVMDTTPVSATGAGILPVLLMFVGVGCVSYGIGMHRKK
jgi:PKD repeat protein